MTFLMYSIFISSSLPLVIGESDREELDGREDPDDKEALAFGVVVELQ